MPKPPNEETPEERQERHAHLKRQIEEYQKRFWKEEREKRGRQIIPGK